MCKYLYSAVVLSALFLNATAQIVTDQDVPVAPIPAVPFGQWTNAFVLDNGSIEVAIAPAVGRIVSLSLEEGGNLLRMDEGLDGITPKNEDDPVWLNVGGDWFWPVAQSRWTMIQESDWPPPPVLATRPWEGRGWKNAAGAYCCLLSREYGDPLNIKVTRLVTLDTRTSSLSVRQRIERTGESDIPVTLWNISQVAGTDEVVLPVDEDTDGKEGIRPLLFDLPGESQMTICQGTVVYNAAEGEHKLCSDSERAWIAARKGDVLLIESTITEDEAKGPWPDGGCRVEMYSNAGLGYTEIETLGPEKNLAEGESLQNTLAIEVIRLEAEKTGCTLATAVRCRLGEAAPKSSEPKDSAEHTDVSEKQPNPAP